MTPSEVAFFRSMTNRFQDIPPAQTISEYVQDRRVLPPSTPFPGPWDNARTPYLVEIQNNLSPYSPTRRTVVKKGAQIGMTAAAENVVAYFMDACPAEILYVSATQELLEKWATKRLEPLIDSLGFRGKITAQTENAKSRRSGDKTFSKQFIGGALDMASAQSAPSLRSDSKRILIRDEIDGAPAQLKTGEGNWLAVSKARTNAWGARAKILDLSTPGTAESSNIDPAYEEGDCREFYVPCPHCGALQSLSFSLERFEERMVPERNAAGHLVGASLTCEACGEAIKNHHKTAMLAAGVWRSTREPVEKDTRSYHLPSILSPMMSWVDLFSEFEKVKDDPREVRSFVNLYLGLAFRETGRKPKIDNVYVLRGSYLMDSVPDGVIYLTAGIDVQRGKNARIEMLVMGHGLKYHTWVVDYRVFIGPTEYGPDEGAWALLDKWAREGDKSHPSGGLVYHGSKGRAFPVQMVFVDSGDGVMQPTTYQFAAKWKNTFPIKGESAIRSHEKQEREGDVAGKVSEVGYMHSQVGKSGQFLYRIGTNYYKRLIYRNLEIAREGKPEENLPQKTGFMDFPSNIEDEYFKQLLAEEMREDGSYHTAHKGVRNEGLDCTVYAMCAGDVWLHGMVNRLRDIYRKDYPHLSVAQIQENVTPRTVLERWAQDAGIPKE